MDIRGELHDRAVALNTKFSAFHPRNASMQQIIRMLLGTVKCARV